MTTARTKRLTFEEWSALPETKQKCEVVDGVPEKSPGPLGEHIWESRAIFTGLDSYLTVNGLGIVFTAPYDIVIRRDPLRVRQPDLFVVNSRLTGIASPSDLLGRRFLDSSPLLVVEVLSPSNTPRDIAQRMADYGSIGVPECWLARFPSRTVEVVRLTPESTTTVATYGMGDVLRSEVLPGFALPIDDIFGPLLR